MLVRVLAVGMVVCLSVCLSHSQVKHKLSIESCRQCHMIDSGNNFDFSSVRNCLWPELWVLQRFKTAKWPSATVTDRYTDANRFYNLSHAICYRYGAESEKETRLFRRYCIKLEYLRPQSPSGEKLCIKSGSQIGGWVFPSLDHVIHAGQKYTISSPSGRGMSADYKSVFRLAISCTIFEKLAKKVEKSWNLG